MIAAIEGRRDPLVRVRASKRGWLAVVVLDGREYPCPHGWHAGENAAWRCAEGVAARLRRERSE